MNLDILKELPTWLAALIFIGVLVATLAFKKFLFYILKRSAKRTNFRWDDVLLQAIKFPVTLVIIAGFVMLVPLIFTLPERWAKMVSLSGSLLSVLAIALFVQKLLLGLQRRYIMRDERLKTYSGITRGLISVGVYVIFFLIFLDTAGISVTPLIASLGVGGIAVALALQDTLSNLFSGIYIIVDQPIRVGDYILLDSGEEGYVKSIGWRSVRLTRLQNNAIIIPNSKLAGTIITNYDLPSKDMAVLIQVGVDYDSDLAKVEKLTIEVAKDVMKTVNGGVAEFEPFTRYHTFGDSSINYTVILRANEFVDQFLIKHEFVKRLHVRFKEEGITIPFPQRTVEFRQQAS